MHTRRGIVRMLAALPFAQMAPNIAQQAPRMSMSAPRRRVVPMDFIVRYKLRPAISTYGPFLLGEDGQPYDFDDIMWALFEMTKEHWQFPRK